MFTFLQKISSSLLGGGSVAAVGSLVATSYGFDVNLLTSLLPTGITAVAGAAGVFTFSESNLYKMLKYACKEKSYSVAEQILKLGIVANKRFYNYFLQLLNSIQDHHDLAFLKHLIENVKDFDMDEVLLHDKFATLNINEEDLADLADTAIENGWNIYSRCRDDFSKLVVHRVYENRRKARREIPDFIYDRFKSDSDDEKLVTKLNEADPSEKNLISFKMILLQKAIVRRDIEYVKRELNRRPSIALTDQDTFVRCMLSLIAYNNFSELTELLELLKENLETIHVDDRETIWNSIIVSINYENKLKRIMAFDYRMDKDNLNGYLLESIKLGAPSEHYNTLLERINVEDLDNLLITRGTSFLHIVSNLEQARLFIDHCKINARDFEGLRPLDMLIRNAIDKDTGRINVSRDFLGLLELFLSRGAIPLISNKVDVQPGVVLDILAETKNEKILNIVFETIYNKAQQSFKKFNLYRYYPAGNIPEFIHAQAVKFLEEKELIKRTRFKINELVSVEKPSDFMDVIKYCDSDSIASTLKNKKNIIGSEGLAAIINYSHNRDEFSRVLHMAASMGDIAKVKTLIEYGADINSLHGDQSVLYIAAINGHTDIVELLLEKGYGYNEGELYKISTLPTGCSDIEKHNRYASTNVIMVWNMDREAREDAARIEVEQVPVSDANTGADCILSDSKRDTLSPNNVSANDLYSYEDRTISKEETREERRARLADAALRRRKGSSSES